MTLQKLPGSGFSTLKGAPKPGHKIGVKNIIDTSRRRPPRSFAAQLDRPVRMPTSSLKRMKHLRLMWSARTGAAVELRAARGEVGDLVRAAKGLLREAFFVDEKKWADDSSLRALACSATSCECTACLGGGRSADSHS